MFFFVVAEEKMNNEDPDEEQYEYDLIGVTVHTGTADGGHYYSFIKDRTAGARDKWFLFNDAEVKPFDPNQIAAECFGGEMTVSFLMLMFHTKVVNIIYPMEASKLVETLYNWLKLCFNFVKI